MKERSIFKCNWNVSWVCFHYQFSWSKSFKTCSGIFFEDKLFKTGCLANIVSCVTPASLTSAGRSWVRCTESQPKSLSHVQILIPVPWEFAPLIACFIVKQGVIQHVCWFWKGHAVRFSLCSFPYQTESCVGQKILAWLQANFSWNS